MNKFSDPLTFKLNLKILPPLVVHLNLTIQITFDASDPSMTLMFHDPSLLILMSIIFLGSLHHQVGLFKVHARTPFQYNRIFQRTIVVSLICVDIIL